VIVDVWLPFVVAGCGADSCGAKACVSPGRRMTTQ